MSGTGLAWGMWKRAYHEEEEARFSPEERARFQYLKDKLRTGNLSDPAEEYEFQILNERLPARRDLIAPTALR
jgi:hypothetical protein